MACRAGVASREQYGPIAAIRVIAHTLRSTHSPTALRSVEEVTALLLVDEVRTMTDAEQWLVVVAVALLVVAFTGYVGLAVCLVARTVVSIGRRAAAWRPTSRKSSGPDRWPSKHSRPARTTPANPPAYPRFFTIPNAKTVESSSGGKS